MARLLYILPVLCCIGTAVGLTSYLNMMDNCGNAIRKKDAYALRSHNGDEVFNNTSGSRITCTVQVQTWRSDQRLSFYFIDMSIEDSSNDDKCDSSYVAVWDGQAITDEDLIDKYCVNSTSRFQTLTQFAVVRFSIAPGAAVNITLVYTSFTSGTCTDDVYELQCDNGLCVPRSVRCDRFNNCGDNSDQRVGAPSYCPYIRQETTSVGAYLWWILMIVLGVFLISYILYWLCWRPGYIPWRLACCRNVCKQCFIGCCRTCCSKCKCRGFLRRCGRSCRRCCHGRKGRSNKDSEARTNQGKGRDGSSAQGHRGGDGDWAAVGLIPRSGKGSNRHGNGGGGYGDGGSGGGGYGGGSGSGYSGGGDYYDFFNGDGGHARESR